MSEQSLTYESVLELIREGTAAFQREMQEYRLERQRSAAEFDREMKRSAAEFDRRMKETDKKIGKLTDSIGMMVENMVGSKKLIKQFQEKYGYIIESHSRNKTFGDRQPDDMKGEIDLFLENGEIAILIEVKTTLRKQGVRECMHVLRKFRRFSDTRGDKRRFIGAVAGASIKGDGVVEFAHKNGIYVIVQTGDAVEIIPTPEGFQARQW